MDTQEIMFKKQFDAFINELPADQKVLITSHMIPDPDAIASILGMRYYLNKYHPKLMTEIAVTGDRDEQFEWMPGYELITWCEDVADYTENCGLMIILDCHARSRISERPGDIDLSKHKFVCIDHHPEETEEFDLVFSDPTYAAAAQAIADIFFNIDDLSDPELAEILLAGILSDTGNLSFVNRKKAHVLTTVKNIVEASNVDLQNLKAKTDILSKEHLALVSLLLKNMVFVDLENAPGISYTFLEKFDTENHDDNTIATASHLYTFSFVRRVKGYPWGMVVSPRGGYYKVSFRSLPGAPNVKKLCNEHFSGGGHVMAAGGKYIPAGNEIGISAEDVAKKVIEKIRNADIELNPF